jgi:hypothetical protein
MIVFGGYNQNNLIQQDILSLDLENYDWNKIYQKQIFEPLI